MGRGLDLILSKIREQPSPILASRYLALVSELRDEQEKMSRTLDLAEVLVAIRPKEALRLALLAHQADRVSLRPLDIMISVLEAQGKSDRVMVLKEEKRRLEAERTSKTATTPAKPAQPTLKKTASSKSSGTPQREESKVLEAVLLDLMEQADDASPKRARPAQSTLTFPVNPLTPKISPKPLQSELKVVPGRSKETPSLTQLSPRIVKGLQGKKPGDTIIGIRAHSSPPGVPHEIPMGSPSLGEPAFTMDLRGRSDQEFILPNEGYPTAPQGASAGEKNLPTKINSLNIPKSVEIVFTPPLPPPPNPIQRTSSSEELTPKSPIFALQDPNLPLVPSSAPASSSGGPATLKDLLAELGRTAASEDLSLLLTRLEKESKKNSQGIPFPEPLDSVTFKELVARLGPGQPWEKVAWDLLQGLWGQKPHENTRQILESCHLSHQTPGFWGFYLDAICHSGDFRRALWEVRTTLKDRPTLPWVEVAMRRLPEVWKGLGVRGVLWQPEDGVATLLQQLSRSPIPLMVGLVPSLIE